jgi:hypothetical protein
MMFIVTNILERVVGRVSIFWSLGARDAVLEKAPIVPTLIED